jgi:hypothetical protein
MTRLAAHFEIEISLGMATAVLDIGISSPFSQVASNFLHATAAGPLPSQSTRLAAITCTDVARVNVGFG